MSNHSITTPYVRNALDLNRYSNKLSADVVKVYVAAAKSILEEFQRGKGTEVQMARLQAQADQISKTIASAYADKYPDLIDGLTAIANNQTQFQSRTLQKQIPKKLGVNVQTVEVTRDYVQALAEGKPDLQLELPGGEIIKRALPRILPDDQPSLKKVIEDLADSSSKTLQNTLRRELLLGKPNDQIVKELLDGNKIPNGSPLKKTEQAIRTVVQSATIGMGAESQLLAIAANTDITEEYEYLATLDSRTSPQCRALDGQVFKYDDPTAPRPPIHYRCRSSIVPSLSKFFEDNDIEMETGTRASADGQVPADLNYEQWLKTQTPSFQDEVLGKKDGSLFRGGLGLAQLARGSGVAIAVPPSPKKPEPNENPPLQEVGISLDIPSEKEILAPRIATDTGIGNAAYTPIDHINYLADKTLIESTLEMFDEGALNKRKAQSLIDSGYAPLDSQLNGIKLASSYQKKLEENRAKYQTALQNKEAFEANVLRTTVPFPDKWKPVMDRQEAEAYFGDGGYFGKQSFWHGNKREVTENMKAIGADPDLNTRGLYGQGVYAGSSKGIALTYGNPHSSQQEDNTELLEMRIYAKNPYIADEATVNSLVAELYNSGGVTDAGTPQIREFLKAKGYDALYIKDLGYTIAFDKKQVVIVDSVKLTQDMGTDDEFSKPYHEKKSKFQQEMAKADNSENVVWEEAFATDDFDYF